MKISARNTLKGTVTSVKVGPVNAEVTVDIGGGNLITAMITADSVRNLEIVENKPVHVVIKASEVMLAID